ncbi:MULTISPECIES: 2Fe-2S iron-sulfur cluster-binding protein [unclassified Streptomyces]|uniref:2Fe-2S iron-sulfur cluster-binding protein n=1 Tax=unclassified Streptomyces TaxID=2593676 RepID=UPI00278BDC36|nr:MULTISPECIES: 2Fe-2S iron-sulfur cluster-binding protein [unclassified Streptomyces]
MTNEYPGADGWEPVPQGEYDADATAFVQLPPEGFPDEAPLAAPGHGYVPPPITVSPATGAAGADPAATGVWMLPENLVSPDTSGGTAGEVSAEAVGPAPQAAGQTGEWSIPLADGELPDESGEFTSAVVAGQAPPATLPGGAVAPWADADASGGEPEAEPASRGSAPDPAPQSPAGLEVAEPAVEEPETDEAPAAPLPLHDDHPLASYVLRVNGADRPVTEAWIGESLLYVLRERLGLAGAKDGCSQGECGACNVQVDGRLVASCLVPAATTAGSEVRTVEGLAEDGRPSDVQRALAECGSVQCGFCVPGMAMTAHDLLEGNPNPTALETRQALCGNLCRCSGYRGVVDAVRQVADERRAAAEAAAEAASAEGGGEEEPRIPRQAGPLVTEDLQQGGQDPQGDQHGGQA